MISSISTIGNYEYASYWYLHQDGRIEYEMKATGIINTAGCHPGQPGKYGTEVAPGIVGHIHQHIFCARLDMDVDGPANTVVECDTIAPPTGPDNPYGNAFYVEERPLTTECEARRDFDFSRMRYWKIVNPETRNWVGKPTAYKLEAGSAVQPFHPPRQPFRAARPFHPASALGHAVPPGGALPGRRVRQSVAWRRRNRDLDGARPQHREYRSRAVAQFRGASSAAAGGSSGAALRDVRFQAGAVRLLRPESGHRPAANAKRRQLLHLCTIGLLRVT